MQEFRSYFPSVSRKSLLIFNVKVWSDECAACIGAPFSHAVGAGSARPDDVLHNFSLDRQI